MSLKKKERKLPTKDQTMVNFHMRTKEKFMQKKWSGIFEFKELGHAPLHSPCKYKREENLEEILQSLFVSYKK